VFVPSPSAPNAPCPQQRTDPSAGSAQEKNGATAAPIVEPSSLMATGVRRSSIVPFARPRR